jgi:hypothetical protein
MGWDATQSKAGLTYPWNLTHHMAHAWWINALSADPTAGPSYYMVKEGFNSYFNYLSMDEANLWQERQDAWHWLDPDADMQMTLSDALYWANFKGYKDTVYNTSDDHPLSGTGGYPSIEKAVAFARILDYRIQFETNGQNDLGDFFEYLFTLNGGYVFNSNYLVDADQMLSALSKFTGSDFTAFFNKYVYGVVLLPYEPYRLYELGKQLVDDADFDEALIQLADAYEEALAAGEDGLAEEVNSLMNSVSTAGGSSSGDGDDGGGGGGGCFLSILLPFIGLI